MNYLVKVTIIWAVLLVLFELLYKNRRNYTTNRAILLLSIVAGVLIPLIPMPLKHAAVQTTHGIYSAGPLLRNTADKGAEEHSVSVAIPTTVVNDEGWSIWPFVYACYTLGFMLLLANSLFELYKIRRLAKRNPVQLIYGNKVIETGKQHAPYSFMRYIFIDDISSYAAGDIKYIIDHEAAHNESKHWLDLWSVQLFCILLWFHPLIWRFKYLLRLQQEFEADAIASADDAYNYGHFLLRQTLLSGVPSIAHSFHFSSIKNRISMLTKKQDSKSNMAYLLVIPALLGCTLLMAKDAAKDQNTTTIYKGNTFKWRLTDTVYHERGSKKVLLAGMDGLHKRQIVYKLNDEAVYRNEIVEKPASYGKSEWDYNDYVRNEFARIVKNTADSCASVSVSDIIIDKNGKIVNYQMHYWRRPNIPGAVFSQEWNLLHDLEPRLDSIVEQIINEGPKWKPAMINGKPVNSVVSFMEGC